jgi:hypothetical protein
LAEALVKQLTGGDRVAARPLYREYFEFTPSFKLWLACNHRPVIRGTDIAVWRRIRLIPFDVTIPPAEQDRRLAERLRGELPGILAWALAGCLAWRKQGLGDAEAVSEATNASGSMSAASHGSAPAMPVCGKESSSETGGRARTMTQVTHRRARYRFPGNSVCIRVS